MATSLPISPGEISRYVLGVEGFTLETSPRNRQSRVSKEQLENTKAADDCQSKNGCNMTKGFYGRCPHEVPESV